MFSELLEFARSILSFQVPLTPADPVREATPLSPTMVTTRRQSGSKADLARDGSQALESLRQEVNSTSSKKRQRLVAADQSTSRGTQDESTPAPIRKRQ